MGEMGMNYEKMCKKYRQSEVAQFLNGRAYKYSEFRDSGTPIVRIQNLTGEGQQVFSDLTLPDDKYIDKGDLIYAWSSTFGPYIWKGEKSIYHYHIWKIVCNEELIDKFFFYYNLKHGSNKIVNKGTGSIFTHVTKKLMEDSEILLPNLVEQKKIASILKSLDDKIELNSQINSTLEQIAQILFKHWFIDYEFPDENGNPYRSSGGRMVDSELGEIPEGWEVKKLSNICTKVIDGTHDSPKPVKDGYYLVTGKHLLNGSIDFSTCYKISAEDHKKVISRSKTEKGDILFSNIGTLGSTALVDQDFEFSIKNIALFKPLKKFYSLFLFLHFSSTKTQKLLIKKSTGTTQLFFSLKFLRDLELITPPNEIIIKFNDIIQPIFEMRSLTNRTNQNLCDLRDSLLPCIMSGRIRVPVDTGDATCQL